MPDIVIQANNLGKKYTIGHQAENGRYTALRDVLMQNARSLWHKTRDLVQGKPIVQGDTLEEVWALKDVSFEIQQGEAVGIIGRNGAGKSTLLKILSRITEPSTGRVTIKGRVASLLEVGTGFHPELTGRENIYLNGAILGMTRQEIKRKFAEIVAFAEIEKFLDTPVKRYSSGMYVRLAFAVAAHLESEILLVDEVLAVGDATFQKKCLGKMDTVAKEGRTVLFVSHNITAVLGLCHRVLLADRGQIIVDGDSRKIVDQYLQSISLVATIPLAERIDRKGDQSLSFITFKLSDSNGQPIARAYSGEDVIIVLKYKSARMEVLRNVHVAIGVHGKYDENLFHLSTTVNGFEFDKIPAEGTILCKIPCLLLQPGKYSVNLFCTVGSQIADWVRNAGIIEVEPGDFYGSGKLPPPDQGPFMVRHSWSIDSPKQLCSKGF